MADKLKYLITNLVSVSTLTITGSWGEDASYPKENLYNNRMSKRGGFDTAKAGEVIINIGSAQTASYIILMNHNLTAGCTVTLEANTADSWGAPPFSETVTYTANDMFDEFTGASYQYWRLVVSDPTRTLNDIKIGELILGELSELDRNFDFDVNSQRVYRSIQNETVGRNKWTYILENYLELRLSFSILTAAQLSELDDICSDVNGNATPFVVIFENAPLYVRVNAIFENTRPIDAEWVEAGDDDLIVQYQVPDVTLTEETRGIMS